MIGPFQKGFNGKRLQRHPDLEEILPTNKAVEILPVLASQSSSLSSIPFSAVKICRNVRRQSTVDLAAVPSMQISAIKLPTLPGPAVKTTSNRWSLARRAMLAAGRAPQHAASLKLQLALLESRV